MNRIPEAEFYKNVPKKRISSGAVILNANEEVLIVKPSYKDHWSIPGGIVEKDESPLNGCVREVREEIGIAMKENRLLCVDYVIDSVVRGDILHFIFFGGKLDDGEISSIRVDGEEILEYRFLPAQEAVPLLSAWLGNRLAACLEALGKGKTDYLEYGKRN